MTGAVQHHQGAREVAGTWQVARPLRDTSPWHRFRQERACGKATNHCFHADGLID